MALIVHRSLIKYQVLHIFIGYLAISFLLGGCVSAPPRQEFDKTSYVKKIAILQITEPQEIGVMNMGGPAGLFGGLGYLVQGVDSVNKTKQFTEKMKQVGLSPGPDMAQALQDELIKMNYEVVYLSNQRPKYTGKETDYSVIQANADAILDVRYDAISYISHPLSLDYKPWVIVSARLISTKNQASLYYQEFSYGDDFRPESEFQKLGIERLSADSKYAYRSFDGLMDLAEEAADGIKSSVKPIVKHIGDQLRKE